jgi:hypothetical protein
MRPIGCHAYKLKLPIRVSFSRNLAQAYLPDAKFQSANLSCANLQDADLVGANFECATLAHANLQEADLGRANLENVVMGGAVYDDKTAWPVGFDPCQSDTHLLNERLLPNPYELALLLGNQIRQTPAQTSASRMG